MGESEQFATTALDEPPAQDRCRGNAFIPVSVWVTERRGAYYLTLSVDRAVSVTAAQT